jgi:hypothetical protein
MAGYRQTIYGDDEVKKLKSKALSSMISDVHGMMGKELAPKKESTMSEGSAKVYEPKQSESGALMPEARKSAMDEAPVKPIQPQVSEQGNSSDDDAVMAEKAAIAGGKMADMADKSRIQNKLGLEKKEDLMDPSKVERMEGKLGKFRMVTDDGDVDIDEDIYTQLQDAQSKDPEAKFPDVEVNGKRVKVKGLGANKMQIYRKK